MGTWQGQDEARKKRMRDAYSIHKPDYDIYACNVHSSGALNVTH